MEKQTFKDNHDISTLAKDARALWETTTEVAGEKVGEARKRLGATLESGKEIYNRVRDKAVVQAKAVEKTVHEHPYQAMGIAFGVGLLISVLVSRQYSHRDRE